MKIIAVLILSLAFFSVGCSHYGKRGCGKKCKHKMMFEKMDTDKDGAISKKEFDAGHGEMWTKMDANKDGKVTKEEMKAHHKSMKKSKCGKKKHKADCKEKECKSC